MSNVVSRTPPHRYLRSVNDPDYPPAGWIHNPDLSAVTGFDTKYWTVSGDDVLLLDQSARDAIDAAEAAAQKDSTADQTDAVGSFDRAFAEVVLDEINLLRAEHSLAPRTLSQLKTAVRGKL